MKKYTITVVIGLVIGLVIGYVIPRNSQKLVGGISPSGTLQSEQPFAELNQAFTSITATTSTGFASILNSSYDRAVTDGFAYCTSVGSQPAVNTWTLQASTSTVLTTTNTNYVMNISIGTTTSNVYVSTSTYGNDTFRLWPANTYLVFATNATNTGACSFGVHYIVL